MGTVLIPADLMVYQAASATPVGSLTMESSGTGGRLRSPGPTLGYVYCTTATTMSTGTTAIGTAASQRVAYEIKRFNSI